MSTEQDFSIHWRESARSPKFFGIDGHAAVILLFMAIFPMWWKTFIGLALLSVLGLLSYLKMPLVVAGRTILGWLSGRRKLRQ